MSGGKGEEFVNVEKIYVKKVSESVVEQIEKLIEDGTFQSGEKLPSVREMCDMFGVGRSAIRDAIITLKGKGTVDVRQGEGTYIRTFESVTLFNHPLISPESSDVRDLYQVRKMLEPKIAELAATNRSDRHVRELKEIISQEALGDWEHDYNFHMTIAKASGNQIIIQLMQFISATTKKHMNDFHQFIQRDHLKVKKINEQHKDIFHAIRANHAEEAKNKMTEHLEYVERILQTNLWSLSESK